MCTTYQNVPYGPALINYKNRADESLSFKGIGFFKKGQLHMTPFTFIHGLGYKIQFTNIVNGRPALDS